jgi:hypothetical protein
MPDTPICTALRTEADNIRKSVKDAARALRATRDPNTQEMLSEFIQNQSDRLLDISDEMLLNNCTKFPPASPVSPRIIDVEKTQAVQYFPFNGQGSGNGAKNSVPLLQGKSTLLRVYISNYVSAAVTGIVRFDFDRDVDRQTIVFPANGTTQGQPQTAISRINLNSTLNFVIPASLCTGQIRSFQIEVGFGTDPKSFKVTERLDDTLQFQFLKPPRVHGVLVHYTGPDNSGTVRDFGTPTAADFFAMMAQVTRVYPVSGFTSTGFDVISLSVDGFAPSPPGGPPVPGGLIKSVWQTLLNEIEQMRVASHTDDIYLGLVPGQLPAPPAIASFNTATTDGTLGVGGGEVGGKNVLSASTFANLGLIAVAHEVGHAFTRKHIPAGSPLPDDLDPNYPTYGSYPSGSIGEVGVDPLTLQIFDPLNFSDFMGYGNNVWVSPYTYIGLITAIQQVQP